MKKLLSRLFTLLFAIAIITNMLPDVSLAQPASDQATSQAMHVEDDDEGFEPELLGLLGLFGLLGLRGRKKA